MLGDATVSAMIPVNDLERGRAFYTDTLGLKVLEEMAGEAINLEAANGTSVTLYRTPSAGQAAHTLATFDVANMNAEMEELRARGVTFEEYDFGEWKTENGVMIDGTFKGSWFKDPDGNIIGLIQR
jgi:catechol 2,3-dioxygenase-like lactoylglutathione lyase family enzyme